MSTSRAGSGHSVLLEDQHKGKTNWLILVYPMCWLLKYTQVIYHTNVVASVEPQLVMTSRCLHELYQN